MVPHICIGECSIEFKLDEFKLDVLCVRFGQIGRLGRPTSRKKGEKGLTVTSNSWGLWSDQLIDGSFAENDLELQASYGSLPPCINKSSHKTTVWLPFEKFHHLHKALLLGSY